MARITVGSLVRHTIFDTIGIVIEHTMWNGDWGAFRVKFNKPYDRGSSCPIKVFGNSGKFLAANVIRGSDRL